MREGRKQERGWDRGGRGRRGRDTEGGRKRRRRGGRREAGRLKLKRKEE